MLKRASVYIHWPYCTKICTYCNFNKYKVPSSGQDPSLDTAILKDLNFEFDRISPARYSVPSIYFGGGTPSLMNPHSIASIISLIQERCDVDPDVEVTLECNPSVSYTKIIKRLN
jgi:coproporphyrinogen III oxidase-like Fe-S oxidoreductase